MFSSRLPDRLTPNYLTLALERARQTGRQVLDLTESNPTGVGLDYPEDMLAPLADPHARGYRPAALGLSSARAAVAADYQRRGITIEQERVVVTASTSEGYSLLFKLLCDAGDEVLVPRPSYPLFDHLTRLDAVVPVPYVLEYHGVWSIDRESVWAALTPRSRAIVVVTPNNPTGSCLRQDDLTMLGEVCRDRGLALIGDEVFADYPLEPAADAVRSVLDTPGCLTFSFGGLSKTIGLPQVKLAWIAAKGPAAAVADALARLEIMCDAYLSVSTPVQLALDRLLHDGTAVRAQIAARVTENHRRLVEQVERHASCRVLRAEGGWSAVLQVPSIDPEETLVLDLLEDADVLVHPGYFFDFSREAFLVMSLLPPTDVFREASHRILARVEAR